MGAVSYERGTSEPKLLDSRVSRRKRIFIELMTSDRKLKAYNEAHGAWNGKLRRDHNRYRGALRLRNHPRVGPYRRPIFRVLGGS